MSTATTTTTLLRNNNNPDHHETGAVAGLDLFPRPPRTAYDLYRVRVRSDDCRRRMGRDEGGESMFEDECVCAWTMEASND